MGFKTPSILFLRMFLKAIIVWHIQARHCFMNIYLIFKQLCFNPFPNGKILDVAKLKAFADDILNKAGMMDSHLHRVENTFGKGENAGYQHFLLFAKCFLKLSS